MSSYERCPLLRKLFNAMIFLDNKNKYKLQVLYIWLQKINKQQNMFKSKKNWSCII